jgi:uncharacterized radical SAM superfamily Fe-S cluster-containing enzyme
MTDAPTITVPNAVATIEMQTDGTGLRFAIEPSAKWIHISTVMDWELKESHCEEVIGQADSDVRVYSINMFEAEEVINKMRLIIACYEALSGKVASND